MLLPLNNTTVTRQDHPVRVLQFGEGNFLRAFADWMIDVANSEGITDTSVAVVSPRFRDNAGIKTLRSQDGLFHVCLEGIADGKPVAESRLITCVNTVLSPQEDYKKYEEVILSPELRFVISNTTEAGIRYESDDVTLDIPLTFPGKVTSLLYKRYRHYGGDTSKGLIFLCCELIEDNGSTLREIVLRHAREASMPEEFTKWVENACVFCDTLVDRIVPGFPADTITEVKDTLGYDDNLVVKGERYHVWAIGGEGYEKVREELPLDRAGLNVLFMPSIKEFRDRKVRILNGSHTGMVPVALQLGCATVQDAFDDEDVNRFINDMMDREVLPVIDGDKSELKKFADGILERFYNPFIRHYLKSISLNSLSKWEARNFPTVLDNRAKLGQYTQREIFTFAALLALYSPESGFTPDDNPEHVKKIREILSGCADECDAVRQIVGGGIFVEDFEALVPGFSDKAGQYLRLIRSKGMREALRSINS